MATQAADAVAPLLNGRVAILGHSMGALLAYEVAHHLHGLGRLDAVDAMFLSSHRDPATPPPSVDVDRVLDEPNLLKYLVRLAGTPPEVLENRDLLEVILPALRGDLHAWFTYRPAPRPTLELPLFVYAARDDVAEPLEEVAGWAWRTSRTCTVRYLNGGHFALFEMEHPLVGDVTTWARDCGTS